MSQKVLGMLGAVAVSVACGAVQLASGHDLTVGLAASGEHAAAPSVNRTAKADRAAIVADAKTTTRTVAIHVERVPDTSVLVRLPMAQAGRGAQPASPVFLKPNGTKA